MQLVEFHLNLICHVSSPVIKTIYRRACYGSALLFHRYSSLAPVVCGGLYILNIKSVYAQCKCGYSVNGETYADAIEADFLHLDDISNNGDWQISSWPLPQKPYPMKYEKQNVVANPLQGSSGQSTNGGDPGLQLIVRGPTQEGANVSTAELVTRRRDLYHGSYRAAIKYSKEPGTCGALFWVSGRCFLVSSTVDPEGHPCSVCQLAYGVQARLEIMEANRVVLTANNSIV